MQRALILTLGFSFVIVSPASGTAAQDAPVLAPLDLEVHSTPGTYTRLDLDDALAEGTRTLTPADAARMAAERSPRVAAADASVVAAEASVRRATAALVPRLDLLARYVARLAKS